MLNGLSLFKKIVIAIISSIPVIAAIVWVLYLKRVEESATGAFLSPVDSAPVIITLLIFVTGYLLFLFIMFYDNLREMVHKTTKTKNH